MSLVPKVEHRPTLMDCCRPLTHEKTKTPASQKASPTSSEQLCLDNIFHESSAARSNLPLVIPDSTAMQSHASDLQVPKFQYVSAAFCLR